MQLLRTSLTLVPPAGYCVTWQWAMGSTVRRWQCAGFCGGSRCIVHRWAGGYSWASTSSHCIIEEERRDTPIRCLVPTYIMCMLWKCCNLRQFFAGKFMGFWRRAGIKLLNDVLFLSFLVVCPVELFLPLFVYDPSSFVVCNLCMYVYVCTSVICRETAG